MPLYEVTSPLKRDGKLYGVGGQVEMEAAEAKSLQDIGVLGAEVGKTPSTPPPRPNAQESIRLAKAAESIEALDQLAAGEERKSVQDAIAARRQELES